MFTDCIAILANVAAIVTAGVAIWAYGKYRWEKCQRQRKLEGYLREEKLRDYDLGQRTILHLMANLSMSEADIMTAAFDSKVVSSRVSVDDRGHSKEILFEYGGTDVPLPRKG